MKLFTPARKFNCPEYISNCMRIQKVKYCVGFCEKTASFTKQMKIKAKQLSKNYSCVWYSSTRVLEANNHN